MCLFWCSVFFVHIFLYLIYSIFSINIYWYVFLFINIYEHNQDFSFYKEKTHREKLSFMLYKHWNSKARKFICFLPVYNRIISFLNKVFENHSSYSLLANITSEGQTNKSMSVSPKQTFISFFEGSMPNLIY